MAADAAPTQERRRIARDDREDREQRPLQTTWLRGVEEQVVVERHADIERSCHPHRPSPEALPTARNKKKGGQAADQREREHGVDVDALEQRAAVSEEDAQRKQQPGGSA